MTGTRLFPHRAAAPEAVAWGAWQVSMNGGEPEAVPERLGGWDYLTEMTFLLQPSIRSEALRQSTGIERQSAMALIATADCQAANNRFITSVPLSDAADPDLVLQLQIPKGVVARRLHLSAYLVLGHENRAASAGVATKIGSRLAQSEKLTVVLEGEGARFPTEVVSFQALGLEPGLWSLRVDTEGLEANFVGGVRLLINADHVEAAHSLSSDTDSALYRTLQMDIARQVVGRVAQLHPSSADLGAEWDEGSLGATAQQMCSTLLRVDLASCERYFREEPARFERIIQDAFRPWEA